MHSKSGPRRRHSAELKANYWLRVSVDIKSPIWSMANDEQQLHSWILLERQQEPARRQLSV